MAGGAKESPRQRMIGMMYLVLTALLALQVSNAVLDKFIFIDESLQESVRITKGENEKIMDGIKQAVEKSGGRDKDMKVLKTAEEVSEKSTEVLHKIDEIREQLVEKSGGLDEEGRYVGAKDYDKLMTYMLGPENSKSGAAYDLEKQLDGYVEYLNGVTDSLDIPEMTKSGAEMEMYKNNEDQKNKDWAQLNFDHTPTVAGLAILSQFEQEVAARQKTAMEYLAQKVGADIPKFDKIVAYATAESKYVAAGTDYNAKLFLAASSSTARPRMSTNAPGGIKKINENGVGEISFKASGGNYDKEGNSKRTWTGNITLRLPTGDSTFTVKEEYVVVQPVIQIRSASVSALYLRCGNELQVDVPALGVTYDPSFSADGADAIKGAKKGLVTVVPNRASVNLTVSSGGTKIGTEKFKVRKVPKPSLKPYSGNRPIDLKTGVAALSIRNIEMRAIPDEDFASFLPKDARFRVTRYTVTLARGKRPVATVQASSPNVAIASLIQKAKPGGTDRLVIEVKEVQRMNFKGRTEPVSGMNSEIFTIPLN